MKFKRIVARICAVVMLSLCACGQKEGIPKLANEIDWSLEEFEMSTFQRKIPYDYTGKGEIFDLQEDDYSSNSNPTLTPITLHCSDGIDRQSYALNEEPAYLSDGTEGSETANGACSSVSNLTLLSQVGLLEGNSIETILDELISRQVSDASSESIYMVSNTLRPSPNVFLTNTVFTEDNNCLETFYVLELLDKETVQLYILSRAYEDMDLTSEELETMDTDELMRYCLSSDENRAIYCGALQYLLAQLNK